MFCSFFFQVDIFTPLSCYIVIYLLEVSNVVEVVRIFFFCINVHCIITIIIIIIMSYPIRLSSYIMTSIMASQTFKIRYLVVIYCFFSKSVMTQETTLKYTPFFICIHYVFFRLQIINTYILYKNTHYFKYLSIIIYLYM